jgi:hypothetical protein
MLEIVKEIHENGLPKKTACKKIKDTLMNKFGVDHPMCVDEIKEKIKNTCIEKYGYSSYTKTNEYKEKTKKTNLEKFGVEYSLQSDIVRDKARSTYMRKYGVDHNMKVKEIRDKAKVTFLKNYGVNHPSKSDEIKQITKNTCINRYGVDNPSKSESIRGKTIIGSNENYIKYIGDNISLFRCDVGHEFGISSDNYHSRIKNKTPLCTICYPIGDSSSIQQIELSNYIKSVYSGQVMDMYRDELEIDIFIPEFNIGFEFNGVYWHSEEYKDKNYHLNKTNFFKQRGIRIIHIWEDDWNLRKDILKSQIKNLLNLTKNSIYARNCKIQEISDSKLIRKFLDDNHVQGFVNSNLKIGLMFNDELVSVMTFDRFEGRNKMKDDEWNLNRFCSKIETNIVGGFSKMLNFFIKKYSPDRIISYADKTWSFGESYTKFGFNKVSETPSDYKYVVNGERVHKSRFRKSKLDTNLSESEYMHKKQIPKIWDCGKIKFEINLSH